MTEPAAMGLDERECFEAFSRIVALYERRRGQNETAEYKATPRGMFAASPAHEVFNIFTEIGLNKYRSLCDLGSGNGLVAHLASLFTEAWGIEADPALVAVAEEVGARLDVGRKARFLVGDYLEYDLSRFEALYIYPDRPDITGLEFKLMEGFHGVLIVYGPHFRPKYFREQESYNLGPRAAVLYAN